MRSPPATHAFAKPFVSLLLQVGSQLPKMLHDSNAAALGATVQVLDKFVEVASAGSDFDLDDLVGAVIERAMGSKPSVQQNALEAVVKLAVRNSPSGGNGTAVGDCRGRPNAFSSGRRNGVGERIVGVRCLARHPIANAVRHTRVGRRVASLSSTRSSTQQRAMVVPRACVGTVGRVVAV